MAFFCPLSTFNVFFSEIPELSLEDFTVKVFYVAAMAAESTNFQRLPNFDYALRISTMTLTPTPPRLCPSKYPIGYNVKVIRHLFAHTPSTGPILVGRVSPKLPLNAGVLA